MAVDRGRRSSLPFVSFPLAENLFQGVIACLLGYERVDEGWVESTRLLDFTQRSEDCGEVMQLAIRVQRLPLA